MHIYKRILFGSAAMCASLYAQISDGIILYYDENFCTMFVPICHYQVSLVSPRCLCICGTSLTFLEASLWQEVMQVSC